MRTTITIEDNLLARLKRKASETNSTVSKLIQEAVRIMLNRPPLPAGEEVEFKLVRFGAGGRFTRYNIDKTSSLIEADDVKTYTPRER